jgi:hypothetical protein
MESPVAVMVVASPVPCTVIAFDKFILDPQEHAPAGTNTVSPAVADPMALETLAWEQLAAFIVLAKPVSADSRRPIINTPNMVVLYRDINKSSFYPKISHKLTSQYNAGIHYKSGCLIKVIRITAPLYFRSSFVI